MTEKINAIPMSDDDRKSLFLAVHRFEEASARAAADCQYLPSTDPIMVRRNQDRIDRYREFHALLGIPQGETWLFDSEDGITIVVGGDEDRE